MHPIRSSLLIILIGLMTTAASPQGAEPDEGSDLYKKSDYKGAISKLRDRKDPKGLFYLGQSYQKLGETKKAISAFEKSVKAGSKIFERALSDRFLGADGRDKSSLDDFIKKLHPDIEFSVGSLSRAVDLKARFVKRDEWRRKLFLTLFVPEKSSMTEMKAIHRSRSSLDLDRRIRIRPDRTT